MTEALEIDGKKFLPIKDLVKDFSYSRDYITRLAREGKVKATHVGRQWFVDADSLRHYSEFASAEQDIRKKQLSEDRKKERLVREAVKKQHTLQLRRVKTLNVRAVAATAVVMVTGAAIGLTGYQISSLSNSVETQLAAVSEIENLDNDISDEALDSMRPSHSVVSLGEIEKGILLLPASTSTRSTEDLFSDNVVLRRHEDGTQAVVQIDAEGYEVGNSIPFVEVPVVSNEI